VEVFAMRSDGSEFPIEIAPVSLIIEGTTYFTGVVRDITERKVLEAKLKAAKDSAEAANEAKSTFLANMSHEIRTPLSAVLGFSNFMISKQLTDEERENYRQIIKRNGALLTNVIDDILDLSKVEAGKVEIEPRECEIHEVLNDIETLLTPQAKDKNLYLTIDIHTDVPRYIYTDSLRLRQILLNVVGNAVKFTEKGGVRVIVHIADTNPASSDIQFDVVDTGPGISAEGVSKIFQPFTQADPSMKRRFGGTGLGLVLAKKLSMLLGGDLSLTKTSVGVGSVFTILVAADLRSARQKNDQTLKIDRAMRPIVKPKDIVSTNGVNRLLGKRILVTEDAPDIRLMISSILNYSGACVENAENGREAIKLMHKKNFDAVLMDLQMPIMDGYEAIKRLREEGYSIPIIALTAHALDDQQEKCRDAGFNAHISKPISVERLVDTIANLTN
jgi:signal transduction histidine kinase